MRTSLEVPLRGSLASGVRLIVGGDVAELAVAVSSAGKKKKLLFFLAETVRWTGWLCCWAGPVLGFGCGAALWAEAGWLRPGRVSPLPSPFSLFIFCFKLVI
jgi:hypothetical protein